MGERIVAVLLLALFAGATYIALSLPQGSWRMPVLAGGAGLILSAIYLLRLFLTRSLKPDSDGASDTVEEPSARGRQVTFVAVISIFVGLIYLIGLTAAVPCFLFIAGVWVYREPVKSTLCMTLVGWATYYILFVQVLGIISYRGVLLDML